MEIEERLSAHTRRLPQLRVGDWVRIQNQTGNFPRRWDKTGQVIEVHQYNQYLICVDGSNRVTVWNRKFLRKFTSALTIKPELTISDDIRYLNPWRNDHDDPTAPPTKAEEAEAPQKPNRHTEMPPVTTDQPPREPREHTPTDGQNTEQVMEKPSTSKQVDEQPIRRSTRNKQLPARLAYDQNGKMINM